jgi:hypothetical protein
MSKCSYCDSYTVVGVLDKEIEQADCGNKYRRFCLNEDCYCWQAMTSREHFWSLTNQFVLPADESADDAPASFEPLDQEAELEMIAENHQHPASANTNTHCFDCPACETKQVGYPAHCRDCGAKYQWPPEADKQETQKA